MCLFVFLFSDLQALVFRVVWGLFIYNSGVRLSVLRAPIPTTATAQALYIWAQFKPGPRTLLARFTLKTATYTEGNSRAEGGANLLERTYRNLCCRLTGCGKYWYRSIDEVTCGDVYEGFFLNSSKSGLGSYTFGTAKARYIGEFVHSSFCGFGIYSSGSEMHQGTFLDDKKHGRGCSTFHPINGCIGESFFVGDFKDGRRHGLGRLNFVNCSTYVIF